MFQLLFTLFLLFLLFPSFSRNAENTLKAANQQKARAQSVGTSKLSSEAAAGVEPISKLASFSSLYILNLSSPRSRAMVNPYIESVMLGISINFIAEFVVMMRLLLLVLLLLVEVPIQWNFLSFLTQNLLMKSLSNFTEIIEILFKLKTSTLLIISHSNLSASGVNFIYAYNKFSSENTSN